jgi:nucleoside-diphosphate-sugar epimerase
MREMAEPGLILVTGAGGGIGGVGSKVVALLRQRGLAVRALAHHDGDRADAPPAAFAALGAIAGLAFGPDPARRP